MHNQNGNISYLRLIITQLSSLVNSLYKRLQQKEKEYRPKYRLVNWLQIIKTEKVVCKIQIVGTCQVINYKPTEIVSDERLIFGFSPQDVCTITNLAHLEVNKPKLKILSVNFVEKSVTIKQNNGEKLRMPIDTIKRRRELLFQLDSKDAFKLGRFVGDQDSYI